MTKSPKTPSSTPKKKDKSTGTPSGSITRSKSFGKIGDFFSKTSESLTKRRSQRQAEETPPANPSLWYRTLHPIKSRQSSGGTANESSGPSGRKSPEGKRHRHDSSPPKSQSAIWNFITAIRVRIVMILAFILSTPKKSIQFLNSKRLLMQRKWRRSSWKARVVYVVIFLVVSLASLTAVKMLFFNDSDWGVYNPIQYYWSDY